MQFSTKYIRMCASAEEIQEKRLEYTTWDKGSFVEIDSEYHTKQVLSLGELSYYGDDFKYQIRVWLPRQDQLQEMIGFKDRGNLYMMINFVGWIKLSDNTDNLEELWLTFVMFIRFNKKWKGKKWEV